jgi:hypothetical protein
MASVLVGGQSSVGFGAVLLAYDLPTVSAVNASSLLMTSGSEVVSVFGRNFGPAGGTWPLSLSMNDATDGVSLSLSCSIVVDHTAMECVSAVGVGRDFDFAVDVGGQVSASVTAAVAYLPPTITSVSFPSTLLTVGGSSFTLSGSNLGPSSYASLLAVSLVNSAGNALACSCSYLVDHSSLACDVPAGAGVNYSATVVVARQSHALPSTIVSFQPPVLSLVNVTFDFATAGGEAVVLVGSGFGPVGFPTTVSAWYGPATDPRRYVAAGCTVVVPDTHLQCATLPGVGGALRWALSIGSQSTPRLAQDLSYLAPVLSAVSAPVLTTAGGELVVLTGSSFGATAAGTLLVTYGPPGDTARYVPPCAVSIDHVQIACTSLEGTGVGHVWTVTVEGLVTAATPNLTTSYLPPSIASVTGDGVDAMPTLGSSVVIITGANLGAAFVVGATKLVYGPLGSPSKYVAVACNMTVPHTQLSCLSVAGVGRLHRLLVSVDGQSSAATPHRVSYTPPVIVSVIAPLLDTRGGENVTVMGNYFGPVAHDPIVGVYGPFVSVCTVSTADTVLTCATVAGVGSNFSWTVEVGLQNSTQSADVTSYRAPAIAVLLADAPLLSTRGGNNVVLRGNYFGDVAPYNVFNVAFASPLSSVPDIVYNATCILTVPHVEVSCVTPPGVGAAFAWWIVVGQQRSALADNTTSFAPPVVLALPTLSQFVTSGGEEVLIRGDEFGPADNNPVQVSYGVNGTEYTAADCAVHVPYTTLRCVTLPGVGRDHVWRVVVGLQQATVNTSVLSSYIAPVIDVVAAVGVGNAALPTEGGTLVHINGSNFGPAAAFNPLDLWYVSVAVNNTLRGASCAFLVEHTSIVCATVAAAGHSFRWQLSTGGQVSAPSTTMVSYAPPAITAVVAPTRLVTSGGDNITVTGSNFGPPRHTLGLAVLYASDRFAASCVVASHGSITCVSAPGVGFGHAWRVVVANQSSPLSADLTSYYAPAVADVTPNLASSLGGQRLVVRGSNLGTPALQALNVSVGAAVCVVDPALHTHTGFECDTSPGPPGRWPLVAETGRQFSPAVDVDVYEVRTLSQPFGPYDGGTQLILSGANFRTDVSCVVLFGGVPGDVELVTPGHIAVVTPNMSEVLTVTTMLRVTVSFDGQRPVPSRSNFTFYFPPRVRSVDPPLGPVSGGTNISVTGDFFDTDFVNATFTNDDTGVRVWTLCALLTLSDIECITPPLPSIGRYRLTVSVETPSDSFLRFSEFFTYYHAHGDSFASVYSFPPLALNATPSQPTVEMVYQLDVGRLAGWLSVFDLRAMARFDDGDGSDLAPAVASYVQLFANAAGAGATLPSDAPVIVQLDTGALIGARRLGIDCRDLEFWSSDRNARVCHWFDTRTCGSNATRFWVRAPLNPLPGASIYATLGTGVRSPRFDATCTFNFAETGATFRQTRQWVNADLDGSEYRAAVNAPPEFAGDLSLRVLPRATPLFALPHAFDTEWMPLANASAQVLYLSPSASALFTTEDDEPLPLTVVATLSASGNLTLRGAGADGVVVRDSAACVDDVSATRHRITLVADANGTAVTACGVRVAVPLSFASMYVFYGVTQLVPSRFVPSMTMFVELLTSTSVYLPLAPSATTGVWQFVFPFSPTRLGTLSQLSMVFNGQFPGDNNVQEATVVSGCAVTVRLPVSAIVFDPPVIAAAAALSGMVIRRPPGEPALFDSPLWLRLGNTVVLRCENRATGGVMLARLLARATVVGDLPLRPCLPDSLTP